ncbi:MAG: hypothetical protein AAGG51_21000 [Cyanobacteria bacterium P01_G01_bin.54]
MPQIRVMNWNIEQFSRAKSEIDDMCTAIARTIFAADIDLVVIIEVRGINSGDARNAMTNLSHALNVLAGGNNYRGWFLSPPTGGELYGFIIRNMNLIRPLQIQQNPNARNAPSGQTLHPILNLNMYGWKIWPHNNWLGNVYNYNHDAYNHEDFVLPLTRPYMPLMNIFSSKGRRKETFRGLTLGSGGYGQTGKGARLPCLAMFVVHGVPNVYGVAVDYYIPIVCGHYAAGGFHGNNTQLTRDQVASLKALHIAQLFNDTNGANPHSYFIDVVDSADPPNHQAIQIQEIMFTGDFNLDFLSNRNGGLGATTDEQTNNRAAYDSLTSTQQNGGSNAPNAQPPQAIDPAPNVPFVAPFGAPPIIGRYNLPRQVVDIGNQLLKTAVTRQGTILRPYVHGMANPANSNAALRGAAFDNFIYGGTQLSQAQMGFGVGGNDSGEVVNIPNDICQGAPLFLQSINLTGVAAYYAATNTKNAQHALRLQAAGAGGLNNNDRLIGARLVSDHLPMVLQFNCP